MFKQRSRMPGGAHCTSLKSSAYDNKCPSSGSEKWLQVSAGERHTCATTATFKLACWGDDGYNKRVTGMPGAKCTGNKYLGPNCLSGSEQWMQVSAGSHHTCATTATFKLWCWGSDSYERVSGMPGAKCTGLMYKERGYVRASGSKRCLS